MAPRGYPAKYAARARELAEAGWRPYQIPALLAREFGERPSGQSVRRWIDPDFAEAERFSRSPGRSPGEPQRRKMWRLVRDRMIELREEARLPCSSIARLLCHDFPGVEVNEEQVRHMLAGHVSERRMMRNLQPAHALRPAPTEHRDGRSG